MYICQRPDLLDGLVMELIVPWRVYRSQRLERQRLEIRAANRQKGQCDRKKDGNKRDGGREVGVYMLHNRTRNKSWEKG